METNFCKEFMKIEAKLRGRNFEFNEIRKFLLTRPGTGALTQDCPDSGLPQMWGNEDQHYAKHQNQGRKYIEFVYRKNPYV